VKLPGPGSNRAALCGDDHSVGVRVKRFREHSFADLRTVRVGSVEELDAEVDGASKEGLRRRVIRRLSPAAGAGERHASVSDPTDLKIARD